MKHGAIFDMDGTLFDTEKLYRQAWLDVAGEFDEEPNFDLPIAACGTNMGEESVNVVKRFYPNVDGEKYVNRVLELVEDCRAKKLDLMAGVEEILKFFRDAGVKMAVASSAPRSRARNRGTASTPTRSTGTRTGCTCSTTAGSTPTSTSRAATGRTVRIRSASPCSSS